MFNDQTDPLGLAVSGRARERRINARLHGLNTIPVGPLDNPMWDAYFQAADEAGRGRNMKFAEDTTDVPVSYAPGRTEAMNQATPFQMEPLTPSNQVGRLSLQSLKRRRR